MPLSESDRNDVILSVIIEMERMFDILATRYPPELDDQTEMLANIESTFKNMLRDKKLPAI